MAQAYSLEKLQIITWEEDSIIKGGQSYYRNLAIVEMDPIAKRWFVKINFTNHIISNNDTNYANQNQMIKLKQ